MLVVFQGGMILKCSMKHQYTPFVIEAGFSSLAAGLVMEAALPFLLVLS